MGGRCYPPLPMKKTSLYLDPELDRLLGRRAAAEGLTKAEFVRRALARVAAETPRVRPSGGGVFEGPGDLAAEVDRHLADTAFGER